MMRFNLAALTVIALLGTGSTIAAQTQHSEVLVGKWEGEERFQSSPRERSGNERRSNPYRTLIIESVGEGEGARPVKGQYGMTGTNLGRINGTLETSAGQARLQFTIDGANVVLDLQGDKDLIGTVALSAARGRYMRLKKVE